MARVFWDTNLFMYLVEGGPLKDAVVALLRRMIERDDKLYTSALTLGEVLVKPSEGGERDLEQEYLELFRSPKLTVVPFDLRTAPYYGRIRRDPTIGPPDAIQLACAAAAEIDLFITNDDRLSRRTIPEIKFVCSLARAPI
jgi:predicted nucleic acid-binding protein